MARKFKIRMKTAALDALWSGVEQSPLDDASGTAHVELDRENGSIKIGGVRFVDLSDMANVEAESALLGGLMIANKMVDEVTHLRADHFFSPAHAALYTTIVERVAAGEIANPVTLKRLADSMEALEDVGGAKYLAQLTGSGAAVIGVRDFANQIIDLSELRRSRAAMLKAVDRCEDGEMSMTASEIAGDLEADLAECIETDRRRSSVDMGTAAEEAAKVIEETAAGKAPAGFLTKGFEDYNHVRGRMEPGDFDLLGGRPSMGKTATSVAIARGAAENGIGTEYLSQEMSREKITRRVLADMIYRQGQSCKYEQLIAGKLSRDDWRNLSDAKDHLATLPFSVSDEALMIEDVGPFLRKRKRWFEKRGWKLEFVVLDHVGRLESRRKTSGETELMAIISRTLKSVAKELGICILALTQLNRGLEARENKRPMLADLRQSGSLEQDADNVVFVYRDEYYLEKQEPPRDKVEKWNTWADQINQVRDDLEIYSSKRREGALAKRIAKFFTHYQAVRDHGDFASAPSFFDDDDAPEMRG